ncbi:Mu transposase domain-containing protein [Acetobacterium wieringae]|uniref:Mu transposase domain-containing protein n=1 Tax=Acetobacterium wieringae TaxID=52694 RepID=UPI003BFA7128
MSNLSFHISVDKMHYSVPYEYIKQEDDVRLTRSIVEVFYHNQRICSHKRLHGRSNQYKIVSGTDPYFVLSYNYVRYIWIKEKSFYFQVFDSKNFVYSFCFTWKRFCI